MRLTCLLLACLFLSACGSETQVQEDAGVTKVFLAGDEGYGDCMPKAQRDEIADKLGEEVSSKDLPRVCGSSAVDRATANVVACIGEYDGNDKNAALRHAEKCMKRFPPPNASDSALGEAKGVDIVRVPVSAASNDTDLLRAGDRIDVLALEGNDKRSLRGTQ